MARATKTSIGQSLDPTLGSEIRETRPCLIVSLDELNRRLSTAIVAPLTSGSRPARFRIETGFTWAAGLILLDQIRVLDQRRFLKQLDDIDRPTPDATLAVIGDMFSR